MGLREEKLDFWKAKGSNALFQGTTGVGKTQLVLATMKRFDYSLDTNVAQWSTPLIDFVGPKAEDADVLFFDDFGDEKSQQAAKEIMSLRRWKGKPIKPTAVIWACYTTPWDEKEQDYIQLPDIYSQIFGVAVRIPTKIPEWYFTEKYGKIVTEATIGWWDNLDPETKRAVHPRRMEQALDMWAVKGDMRDVLPFTANVAKLMQRLNIWPMAERLKELLSDDDAAKKLFFANENNFAMAFKYICDSDVYMRAFLPCFSKEKLASSLKDKMYGDKVFAYTIMLVEDVPLYKDVYKDILQTNTDKHLIKKIRKALTEQSLNKPWSPASTVSETPEQ